MAGAAPLGWLIPSSMFGHWGSVPLHGTGVSAPWWRWPGNWSPQGCIMEGVPATGLSGLSSRHPSSCILVQDRHSRMVWDADHCPNVCPQGAPGGPSGSWFEPSGAVRESHLDRHTSTQVRILYSPLGDFAQWSSTKLLIWQQNLPVFSGLSTIGQAKLVAAG